MVSEMSPYERMGYRGVVRRSACFTEYFLVWVCRECQDNVWCGIRQENDEIDSVGESEVLSNSVRTVDAMFGVLREVCQG